MKESDVKKQIVDAIRAEGGYARRIEDRFTVGMPDMFMVPIRCPPIWAEVKVVDWQLLRPSARQLIELKKLWLPPRCYSFIVGWKNGKLYIHPPVAGILLKECLWQLEGERTTDLFRRVVDHWREYGNSEERPNISD